MAITKRNAKRSSRRTAKKPVGRPPKKKPADSPHKADTAQADVTDKPAQDAMSWISAIGTAFGDFDFEECAKMYEKLEWTWGLPGGARVPTEGDIRDEVSRLVKDAVAGVLKCPEPETSYYCSTGGLCVRAWKAANPDDNFVWIGFVPVDTMM